MYTYKNQSLYNIWIWLLLRATNSILEAKPPHFSKVVYTPAMLGTALTVDYLQYLSYFIWLEGMQILLECNPILLSFVQISAAKNHFYALYLPVKLQATSIWYHKNMGSYCQMLFWQFPNGGANHFQRAIK